MNKPDFDKYAKYLPSEALSVLQGRIQQDDEVAGRGLGSQYLNALSELLDAPEGQWWRDVLINPDVIIAVRNDSVNVYHRGASIFLAELGNGRIVPKTHIKYLVRSEQAYAEMKSDLSFAGSAGATTWERYGGSTTLRDMLKAAATLAGPEKFGLHNLIKNSPHVVDVEIALDSPAAPIEAGADEEERIEISEAIEAADEGSSDERKDNRLDVATLEDRSGNIRLVFHEAKHFGNKELRAKKPKGSAEVTDPPVVGQIQRYASALAKHENKLVSEYAAVCRSLLVIDAMRQYVLSESKLSPTKASNADPLITRVALGAPLKVDLEPRLIVFGFDKDQKDGNVWKPHREHLKHSLGEQRFHAIGNTRDGRVKQLSS
jgi:hypothetical protein